MTRILPLIVISLLVLTGCFGGGEASPVVAITAPMNGATVPAGESVDLSFKASEDSGAGLSRVEVFVNGALLSSEAVPEGSEALHQFTLAWTPSAGGSANVMAVAYAADDTASAPVTLVLTVAEAAAAADEAESPSDQEGGTDTVVASTLAQGRVTGLANVRAKPGILCQQLGQLAEGTVITLLEYSADKQWAKTDVMGADKPGWVWLENVEIVSGLIPQGVEKGCDGCGDGVCSAALSETCATCASDCGACPVPTAVPGATLAPTAVPTVPAPVCGDGVCNGTETISTCFADCGFIIPVTLVPLPYCGDGVCNGTETISTCFADCGFIIPVTLVPIAFCGDGTCNGSETMFSCPADCNIILPWP